MEQQEACLRSNPPLKHLGGPLHVCHTEDQIEKIQLSLGVLLNKQIANKEGIPPNPFDFG